MTSKFDPKKPFKIATGRKSLGKVKNEVTSWELLVPRLLQVSRTRETFPEFMALSKPEQDALKNFNGYWIGAECADGRRAKNNLGKRSTIALDIDDCQPKFLRKLLAQDHRLKGSAHVIHSTRKHTADKPRVRIVFPTTRPINSDEYEVLSRLVAWFLDETMDAIDDVSFRPAQMMYFPTASKGAPFVGEVFEGPGVDPDKLFAFWRARGKDPHNYLDLPFSEKRGLRRKTAAKAEDPFDKPGVIGAFCRAYPIEDALATFLDDFYEPGDMTGPKPRWSYRHGQSSNGLEIEDDGRFAYSFHGTDPLSEQNVNSFDAVRICLFGDADKDVDEETVPIGQRPSFRLMSDFALAIPEVKLDVLETRLALNSDRMNEAFDDLGEEEDEVEPRPSARPAASAPSRTLAKLSPEDEALLGGGEVASDDPFDVVTEDEGESPHAATVKAGKERPPEDWYTDLDSDNKGNPKNTMTNFSVILQCDPRYFKRFAYNELLQMEVIYRPISPNTRFGVNLPVHDRENGDPVQDYMISQIRTVLEGPKGDGKNGYGFATAAKGNVDDAVSLVARQRTFHPVKNYAEKIIWDGVKRLSTVMQRHFLAEDNAYTREAFLLMMVAAMARVYEPGHKYDYCLIIQGEQGIGKSSFIQLLGRAKWYAVFDCGFDDTKAAVEKMLGHLFLEIGELDSFHKSSMDAFKQFMSTQKDVVRLSYERRPGEYKRQSVFFATVNTKAYLRDLTGNRRMWPIESKLPANVPIDFAAWEAEVPQIYAEALQVYRDLRKIKPLHAGDLHLDLSPEARTFAVAAQDTALMETDALVWIDEIKAWLEAPVGAGDRADPAMMEKFDDLDAEPGKVTGKLVRTAVTTKQVWTECLNRDEKDLRSARFSLNEAMSSIPGWERSTRKVRFGEVPQKCYVRKGTTTGQQNRHWMPAPDQERPDDFSDLTG